MSAPGLGPWSRDASCLDALKCSFAAATPFNHVIIPEFLNDDLARTLSDTFPAPHKALASSAKTSMQWFVYNNPIECKFASTDVKMAPQAFQKYFAIVESEEFVDLIRQVSGIPKLETDPHFHGAGLHYHPSGGKLDMHLDYSIHPVSGKERRLNIILYLNDDWDEGWGGHLHLGDANPDGSLKSLAKRVSPAFNTAVLFRTSDISWHGLPFPITCPEGRGRQSLAIYYVTDPRLEVTPRYKAQFVGVPGETESEGMAVLRRIRPTRRLNEGDIKHHAPEWKSTMDHYVKSCPAKSVPEVEVITDL